MSSLLRSTKFIRYFGGAARTLLLNTPLAEVNSMVTSRPLSAINNVILRDYATSKNSENLEPLLQKVDSDVKKYGRISKKNIDEIFNEIKAKNDISSSQSLLVIRCCGELVPEEPPENRTLLVQKIWSVLSEIGVPMDISHYNALLRVYIENEHPFSPAAFLEELERKGIEPNRVTYQRIMWRYCQDGDVDGATKVLEKMRELSMPVSESVLNALVMGHAFYGDPDGAKAVIGTMAGAGLNPSARTYSLLACGYAKQNNTVGVLDTLKTANDNEIYLSNEEILSIIEAFAGNGQKCDGIQDLIEILKPNAISYNQDCYNSILRLINKGNIDTAKEIMKTMTYRNDNNSTATKYQGSFFVKQLLKNCNTPDKIIQTCKNLEEEKLVPNALYIATITSLQHGLVDTALALFKELKNSGIEIRPHFYWPLLVKKGNDNDEEGLLQILRTMIAEGIEPYSETLNHYVIPFLKDKNMYQNTVTKLQIAGIPALRAARSVIIDFLYAGNMKTAANVALQYRPYTQYALLTQPLLAGLSKSRDIDSFITILEVISSRSNDNTVPEDDDIDDSQNNDLDNIIKSAALLMAKENLCDKLLLALYSAGMSIKTSTGQAIEENLGERLTQNTSELLAKLTSTNLKRKSVKSSNDFNSEKLTTEQLEGLIRNAKEGSRLGSLRQQLLQAYIQENNIEKLDNYIQQLESLNFKINAMTKALLIDCYCNNNNINKALEFKQQIAEQNPTFQVNTFKLVKIALALTKADRFDEAIDFLNTNEPDAFDVSSYPTKTTCWQMLNTLAETKDSEKVIQLTNVLIKKHYIEPANGILGPSIKVFLLNNDLEGALKQFEYCSKQYRFTPWKCELMKALILKDDPNKLQWLADLSTQIHGEVNTLHDLVLAFVESGRLKQARRILETPGLYTKQKRFEDACHRYQKEGQTEHLEGLLEATRELSHIDRSSIFYHLLVSYCRANETDKALGLWTLLQEDGNIPNSEFLVHLSKHLKSKGRKVPFIVPNTKDTRTNSNDNNFPKDASINEVNLSKTQTWRLDEAILTKTQISEQLEKLVNNGDLSAAVKLLLESIEMGIVPKHSRITYLLKKLAEDGDVASILQFSDVLNAGLKQSVAYDDKLTQAYFVQGSASEHLETVLKDVKQARSDDQLKNALKRFPRSNALATIAHNDQLMSKCKEIAEVAAAKGYYSPANIMWIEYIMANNESAADEIWNKYLIKSEQILFKKLMQHAFTNNLPEVIEKVIQYLNTNDNITLAAKGNVYSRLISTHLENNNMEKAQAAYDRALSEGINNTHIGNHTITKLNKAIETSSG